MTKRILIAAGAMGAFSVILGAVGQHFLAGNISEKSMTYYEISYTFMMYHTLALLALTFMNRYVKRSYLKIVFYLFIVGIILFSGTLLLSSLKEVTGMGIGPLSKLTPIGGLSLIVGWIMIVFSGVTYKHKKRH